MSIVPLRGFNDFGSFLLEDQLITNLIQMFNWGFLEKGAFFNNTLTTTLPYGGNPATLRRVNDPNFTNGQVWEGHRKQWVWESGIGFSVQPIIISGVYVNNTFYPSSTSGAYSHYVDYINGRVIFNSPIATNSTVKCEHSVRWIQIEDGRQPWFQAMQFGSFRVDTGHFNQVGSGSYEIMAKNRVQPPVVFIEIGRTSSRGAMIGGGKYMDVDVIFSIFGEFPSDVGHLRDILRYQEEQRYSLFNMNLIRSQDAFPLDYKNSRVNNAKMYPTFIAPTGDGGYYWKSFRVKKCHIGNGIIDTKLTTGIVTWEVEVDFPEI